MPKMALNSIKESALECASFALNRVNLAVEESRLSDKYRALGKRLLPALESGTLESLKDDPEVVELVGDISETLARIEKLKRRSGKKGGQTP